MDETAIDMYELDVKNEGHYLHVTVSGELNPTTDAAIDAEIVRKCVSNSVSLVLVDIRAATTRLSMIENHYAAMSFRERMGEGIRAVAIVDSQTHRDKSEIYELTSVNRGAVVKFFESTDDAARWLSDFPTEPG